MALQKAEICFAPEEKGGEGRGKEGLDTEGRGEQSQEQAMEVWVLLGHDQSPSS